MSIMPYKSPALRRIERRIAGYQRTISILEHRRDALKENDPPPLDELLKLVAIHTEVEPGEIVGRRREKPISDIRCAFIKIAIDVYGHSRREVAKFLERDPSTIVYLLNSFSNKALEWDFRNMYATVLHNVSIGLNRQATSRKSIAQ